MSSSRALIQTNQAPAPVGPYSQAVAANGFLFVSGQLPFSPETGAEPDEFAEQCHQTFRNLQAVLQAGGSSLEHCVKVTVYLADLNQFAAMNEVYEQYFAEGKPARACVEVQRLPKDVAIEVDAIAVIS